MPKNRAQGIVYGLLMTLFMTIGMEIYNNAVKAGVNLMPGGFSNMDYSVIAGALAELPLMAAIVFIISNLYGNKVGRSIAERFIDPERDSDFLRQTIIIACTTLVMCPSMSLVASVLFNAILAGRPLAELPVIWLGTVFKNFGMALMWNLFAATPLTRACFGAIFTRERNRVAAPALSSE
jgi:hypothetical protein